MIDQLPPMFHRFLINELFYQKIQDQENKINKEFGWRCNAVSSGARKTQ
jgi:hypothetical protein